MRWTTTTATALSLVLVGLGGSACAQVADARPQWVIHIATDAPVPQLGDRILVEVLDERGEACTGCRRQLGVPSPDAWPLSFGVVPSGGGGLRVRARLYRSNATDPDGFPAPPLLIDVLARLPSAQGVTDVEMPLEMRCFGIPADPTADTSCDPATGAAASIGVLPAGDGAALPAPGSWPPARLIDCEGAAPEGMTCVPGGVFLLGSPEYLPLSDGDPVPEQLVALSPFWLDQDEMTVARLRPLLDQGLDEPVAKNTLSETEFCAFEPNGGDDTLSVNCVPFDLAQVACELLGKRLPTEAEWEYAAGNLGKETPFSWTATPVPPVEEICANVIVGRGRGIAHAEYTSCMTAQSTPGPVSGGAAGDVTELGLRNMAGNLSEWAADGFVSYGDPTCWAAGVQMLQDPLCDPPNAMARSLRGAGWDDLPYSAHSYARNAGGAGYDKAVGFRCAKSVEP